MYKDVVEFIYIKDDDGKKKKKIVYQAYTNKGDQNQIFLNFAYCSSTCALATPHTYGSSYF